ncbi:MAG: PilZ domain-containing protein [Pseudomonadota bacterium]|nr:PilZ domain-containing protein [Pseudomonadota bacterium]
MNSFRSAIQGGKAPDREVPLVREKHGHDSGARHLASIEIARDVERSANHRDSDRHRLSAETAVIAFKGKRHDVELINISGGGAMIRADIAPRLWDRIDLTLGEGAAIECAVRWIRGDRIGLEFAHETRIECDPATRNALLLDVIRRSFPDSTPMLAGPETPAPPEPCEQTDPSRRGDKRHPLIWNGELLWHHDSHDVRLRNISESGALIDCGLGLPAGADVMLDLGDKCGQFFATVTWSRGGQAGLSFADSFDLALLARARPEIAQRNWQRPGFLDLGANQASPWAEEWERSSIDKLRADLEGFMKH